MKPFHYHPIDCTTALSTCDLLPGAPLRLSPPDVSHGEVHPQVDDFFLLGHIRSSSSPVAAGVFFVDKKDKKLHPCIDYHAQE